MRSLSLSAATAASCFALALLSFATVAQAAVTVSVSPDKVDLRVGGSTKKFYVSVSGTTDKTVAWSVNGIAGGNATVGTIAADGTYTPPVKVPTPNIVQVMAKSSATGAAGANDTAAVTLQNPVPSITTIDPSSFNIGAFTLKLTGKGFLPTSKVMFGTTALTVTYVSATELTAKGSSTAENQSFIVEVVNPDPGGSGSNDKTVKVMPPVTISISPTTKKLRAGDKVDFAAYLNYTSNKAVTWSVNGIVNGNATFGTIDAEGIYQAPPQMPPTPAGAVMSPDGVEVKVMAKSQADPKATATASVFIKNDTPEITSATPNTVAPGPIALVIRGSGFAPGATVRLGGALLTAAAITPTQINVTGNAVVTPAGIAPLIVTNPDPGGATSNAVAVPITVTGPLSRPDAARFLELATFGPTPALLARLQREGIGPYLDEQLNMGPTSIYADPIPDQSSLTPMRRRFFMNAVNQSDQLRQRMAFALSQLFVVSATSVGNDYQMIPYQEMLLANAFGNYYDVLRSVTLHPTMGRFLDMVNNVKANPERGTVPNENYAREVLQLFTVGQFKLNPDGSQQRDATGAPALAYDEAVVANLARVFTGWTYPTRPGAALQARNPSYYEGPMEPWEANHDTGQKVLMDGYIIPSGRTAREDLDLALRHIFNHPNVGPFVVTRLIRHFVTSNPSLGYVSRATAAFNASPRGDLRRTLRAILTDPEAMPTTSGGGHLKEPILYEIMLARSLGATVVEEHSLNSYASNMSQNLFQPPSVFNYFSPNFRIQGGAMFGPEFQIYTPSNAVDRANFVYRFLRSSVGGVNVNLDDFINLAAEPEMLILAVDNALYQGRMPTYVRQALRPAIDATQDRRTRARNALQIAALAGDYLVIH